MHTNMPTGMAHVTSIEVDERPGCEAGRCRYPDGMCGRAVAVVLSLAMLGCDGVGLTNGSDRVDRRQPCVSCSWAATTRRTDLPASAQACVNGVGATHTHPSWRSFAAIPLQAVPPDRYEITFTDVPVNTRVSFRVNDQNACDENPTGAVTRNVFVNDIRLIQNATTPGNGDEPGFAFTVAPQRDGQSVARAVA